MSDWDASDNEVAPVVKAAPMVLPKKTKWQEEEEDDVVEDWDASSDEENSKPATPAPVAPPKKKGTLKQKIAEKEAERRARIENGEESEDEELDELEKRRLAKEKEVAADLSNAADLLGASHINGKANGVANSSVPSELAEILSLNPKTKDDFAKLSRLIIENILKKHEDKPLYATFIEMHVRDLAQPLRDVDVRKAASGLTTLANEKQKEKSGKGKKPKGAAKPVLGAAKALTRVDTSVYDESLDDFGKEADDFM